jgi:RNA polymerase sigma factor (sigma-70 family)
MVVDKVKFIETIDKNQAIINRICYGYADNGEDRIDLKQEILVQLWKAYPKFNQNCQISTWIYRIALNTAISNYRKSKRRVIETEFTNDLSQLCEDDNNSLLDENLTKLYQLIYQLKDLERAIILLYLDDLSYKEIAEIIGISETNVVTKINRIKSKLKIQFNNN